jgi:hypothetical protein
MALGGYKAPGGRARDRAKGETGYKVSDDSQFPVYKAGYDDGASETKSRILGRLEQKYLDPDVERGSDEGNAILALAKDVSEFIKREEAENPL